MDSPDTQNKITIWVFWIAVGLVSLICIFTETIPSYIGLEFWQKYWPTIAFPLFLTLILCGPGWGLIQSGNEKRTYFVIVLSLSMLGMSTGFLIGLSQSPTVDTVIPAVLTLIGGLTIFLLDKGKNRILIGFCILGLSITLLVGALWGAKYKEERPKPNNESSQQ